MVFTHGDQITRTNVGPTGTLTPSGPFAATNGQVIQNLEITGSPAISIPAGAQVIIRNCRLIGALTTSGAGYTLKAIGGGGLYVQLEDTEIITRYPQTKGVVMFGDGNISIKRCVIRGGTDTSYFNPPNSSGVISTGDTSVPNARVLIEDSWLGDTQNFVGDPHNDCVQIDGGGYAVVRRCNLFGFRLNTGEDPLTTNAVATQTASANSSVICSQNSSNPSQISFVAIRNCLVNGGNYTIAIAPPDGLPVHNLYMSGTKFGLVHRFGPLRFPDTEPNSLRSGNTWAATGTTGSGLVVTSGQSIPGESSIITSSLGRVGDQSSTRSLTITDGTNLNPKFRAKTTSISNSGTTPSIVLPNTSDGAAVGQLATLVLAITPGVPNSTPSNWIPLPGSPTVNTPSTGRFYVWQKRFTISDLGSTLTIPLSATSRSALACITTDYAVFDLASIIKDETNTSGTTVTAPSADPITDHGLLINIYGPLSNTAADQPTWTPPSTGTERVDITTINGSTRNATMLITTEELTSGDSTGPRAATATLPIQRQSISLVLAKPKLNIERIGDVSSIRSLVVSSTFTLPRISETSSTRQLSFPGESTITVLRTTSSNYVFVVPGDPPLVITSQGVEVPSGQVASIITNATNNGVTLIEGGTVGPTPPPAPPVVSRLDDLLDVNTNSPTDGQLLKFDIASGNWINATVSGGGSGGVASVAATDSTITIGGTSTNPTVGVNNIPESKVTNLTSDLSTISTTISGKANTSHTHTQSDVTSLTSNLAAKASLTSGKVPTSELGSGTADNTTFLRGDQSWATPSGGSSTITIPADKTADYTLVLADAQSSIGCNLGTPLTVTVPPNSSSAFTIGTVIEIRQTGVGRVTIAPGAGVTLRSADSYLTTRTQYSAVSLLKIATNTWNVSGDLAV